jgi:diaminopimelate epimerase
MASIPFCKFHGFGNDYIVIEQSQVPEDLTLPDLARSITQRHTGAGSDGIAVLEKLDGAGADFHCEIVNPDGSVAGFSGNGTRCAVAYLHYKNMWSYPGLRLRTKSGVKSFSLVEETAPGHYWFESEIGKPRFASDEIPVLTDQRYESVIDKDLELGDKRVKVSCVNVGNPVAVVFVDNFDFDWRAMGKELESHSGFPEKANIVFIRVLDRENIEIKIWERGAGETSSSGTCCAGAAILTAFTGRTERTVSVLTEGGTTEIHWRDDDEMIITGSADLSYCGEWPV